MPTAIMILVYFIHCFNSLLDQKPTLEEQTDNIYDLIRDKRNNKQKQEEEKSVSLNLNDHKRSKRNLK